jgi:hypothetical protein
VCRAPGIPCALYLRRDANDALPGHFMPRECAASSTRHCERSEAIHCPRLRRHGLLRRGACHRARIRATRWLLAMTTEQFWSYRLRGDERPVNPRAELALAKAGRERVEGRGAGDPTSEKRVGVTSGHFDNTLNLFGKSVGEWCNGSTTDSDSVCLGSNPGSPATFQPLHSPDSIFGRLKTRYAAFAVIYFACSPR